MSPQSPRRRPARRPSLRALGLGALLAAAAAAPAATAAPVDVQVRVEGTQSTIYDRTIRVEPHTIQALSDDEVRKCDGTNNPGWTDPDRPIADGPNPTATSATVDAMASIGQRFDGNWYDGYEDYFITQWGPDRETSSAWWGILVNGSFTPVGGCQFPVVTGDEVLWVNDAFAARPFLSLSAPATATVDVPATVHVNAINDGTKPDDSSAQPYEGATVGGVTLAAQPVAPGVIGAGTSDASGDATVTFHQTGWQRVKARTVSPDGEASPPAIASNSVDVCVTPPGGGTCAGPAPGTIPWTPPVDPGPDTDPVVTTPTTTTPTPTVTTTTTPTPTPEARPVRLGAPVLRTTAPSGRVTLGWTVLDAGAGIRDWTVLAKPLGGGTKAYAVVARGTSATSATLALSAGRSYDVRLQVTDALGHASTGDAGRVLVPTDDRAKALSYRKGWKQATDPGAWKRTVRRGGTGATASVRLPAGKPLLVVRSGRKAARVEVTAGGTRRTFAVTGSRTPRTQQIVAPARAKAGSVRIRVVRGTLSLDGVAIAP